MKTNNDKQSRSPRKTGMTQIIIHLRMQILSTTRSLQQNATLEVKRSITSAWKAFWSLKFVLLDIKINRRLRFVTLETCIFPVILYGCQTWDLTSKLSDPSITYESCKGKYKESLRKANLKRQPTKNDQHS